MSRRAWIVVLIVADVAVAVFMFGVFAGWWPYLWWTAFR